MTVHEMSYWSPLVSLGISSVTVDVRPDIGHRPSTTGAIGIEVRGRAAGHGQGKAGVLKATSAKSLLFRYAPVAVPVLIERPVPKVNRVSWRGKVGLVDRCDVLEESGDQQRGGVGAVVLPAGTL